MPYVPKPIPATGLIIPLLDVDRQGLTVRLGTVDARIEVWYQPGTSAWYASAEVPVGTKIVTGRRLSLDGGLWPEAGAPVAGNIYCRSTGQNPIEPGDRPWGLTHLLVYEP